MSFLFVTCVFFYIFMSNSKSINDAIVENKEHISSICLQSGVEICFRIFSRDVSIDDYKV